MKLSDDDKLRIRFADAPDEDLETIVASESSSALQRRIATETLEQRRIGAPAVAAAPKAPRHTSKVGYAIVAIGIVAAGLSAANTLLARRRAAERVSAEFDALTRAHRDDVNNARAAAENHAAMEQTFAEQRVQRRASWTAECSNSASACLRAAEFYRVGDFEHGQPADPEAATWFRARACAAGRREACDAAGAGDR